MNMMFLDDVDHVSAPIVALGPNGDVPVRRSAVRILHLHMFLHGMPSMPNHVLHSDRDRVCQHNVQRRRVLHLAVSHATDATVEEVYQTKWRRHRNGHWKKC